MASEKCKICGNKEWSARLSSQGLLALCNNCYAFFCENTKDTEKLNGFCIGKLAERIERLEAKVDE